MMLPFNKKKAEELKKKSEELIAASAALQGQVETLFQTPISEFLPYYCHYNPYTLLTKNGELLQIIKVAINTEGLNYESGNDKEHIVREVIRNAILEHVPSSKFAFWMHTMRKRQPIVNRGKFREPLASKVHERWQQVNRWKYQYYNEVYISVLHIGQTAMLTDTQNLKDLILPNMNRQFRNRYLEKAEQELSAVVAKLMGNIEHTFRPERLSIVERLPDAQGLGASGLPLFYSEPMEFIGTLLNLRAEQMLLPQLDVSEALPTTRHTFGFNALETKSQAGKRRFGAILSMKQYREVPSDTVDKLLQAPMEFIVSQAFTFIPHQGALEQYRLQKEMFEISGDIYCIEASGIADMMGSIADKETDFGQHQTTIMVLSDELKHLDGEVTKVQAAFAELGLITIREDIKLEECFWSQLPGNFEFIRRKDTLNTARIGGFCRLNRYPQGTQAGNHWGEAVTILSTLVGSPYFFNFHHQDNGHTLVLDFNSFTDQACPILINFLLCQSRKFDGRLYVFDRHRSADLLMERLGGAYHYFPALQRDPDVKQAKLNPFRLEDSPRNRGFLLAWLGTLLAENEPLTEEKKETLRQAIGQVYEEAPERRVLSKLVEFVAERDVPLAKLFMRWTGEGEFAPLFNSVDETFDVRAPINGFDMEAVMKKPASLLPVFSYLLHRIVSSVDGRPTLIIMHEAFDLLDNSFVAPRLESLMQVLQENNAMLLLTSSKPQKIMESQIYDTVFKQCASVMYLPDDIVHDYASMPIGLSDYDSRKLLRMDRQQGDFMLRQNNETIALRAPLKELDEQYAIFANDRKNLAAALGTGADGTLGG